MLICTLTAAVWMAGTLQLGTPQCPAYAVSMTTTEGGIRYQNECILLMN